MIEKFIDDLAKIKNSDCFYNQYSYEYEVNSIRRNNLLLYLKQIKKLKPKIMLCGEAPSYRGMRLTGVPFTSRKILKKGIEKFYLFGEEKGYKVTDEFEGVNSEPTATMIWETMVNLDISFVGWNAFPFHPFKKGDVQSNRLPTTQEVKIGEKFLEELIDYFKIKKVVAVGNTAFTTLSNLEIKCDKVRHPANGGKTDFVKGINKIFKVKNVV